MTLASLLYTPSLSLIVLIITIIIDVFLAIAVLANNPKSATNRIFFVLTASIMFWLLINYLSFSFEQFPFFLQHALLLHRLGIFMAAPMSLCFFLIGHTLPSDKIRLDSRLLSASYLGTFVMMALNVSPYAFVSNTIEGYSSTPVPGIGLIPFSVVSTLFSIFAVYFLFQTYKNSKGIEKTQAKLVLVGILTMLGFIILTILIPIIVSDSLSFLLYTPLYTLVFLGFTAYAIVKYQLFSIKVLLAQALTLVICVVLFAKIFGETTPNAQVADALILLFMIIFGFFLVRSVGREVEQRKRIEGLAKDLEEANKQQQSLIRFITHQVKGFFTTSKNVFAELLEGTYGAFSEDAKVLISKGLESDKKGVDTVQEILNAANIRRGTVQYTMADLDAGKMVSDIVQGLLPNARAKNLELVSKIDPISIKADATQIREVFKNLIDNAIKYTPTGTVNVALARIGDKALFSVKDSGKGITDEDKKVLFTEGGRGKDSTKVNVESTGYGLFIVKGIVNAHKGRVWAESEGEGKGSTFFVELPLQS